MTAPRDDSTSDLHAIIVALRKERDAALAREVSLAEALAARDAERSALLARQAASAEVLKAISTSPDDTRPVFELIARRGRQLCGAARASVTQLDGALLHMRARDGYDEATALLGDQDWPRLPGPETVHGRAVLTGAVIYVHALLADDAYAQTAAKSCAGLAHVRCWACHRYTGDGRSAPLPWDEWKQVGSTAPK